MKKLSQVFLVVFFIIFLMYGCEKENNNSTIKLEPTVDKKLTLGKVRDIIQLETSEESLIEYVTKTFIDGQNNRIFVNSDMNIFMFDLNGKYITKLKKGKGPGEVNMIVSFAADAENKRFYALDLGSIIHIYDYDANFIETQKLSDFYSLDIHPIDKENVFLYCNYVGRQEKYFVGIYNLPEKKITKRFVSSDESPYSLLCSGNASNFYEIEGRLFFTSANIFGLFEFETDTFRRTISYDLGNRAVPESFYASYVEKRNRSGFGVDALDKGFVPFVRESFYFNDHFVAILYDENSSCYAINAKNREKVYMNGQLSDYFNLPKVESLTRMCELQKDFMTLSCSPLDFFEHNQVEETREIGIDGRLINVSYDANPFLIIVE